MDFITHLRCIEQEEKQLESDEKFATQKYSERAIEEATRNGAYQYSMLKSVNAASRFTKIMI